MMVTELCKQGPRFHVPFLTKPHPCLFILLQSQLGKKYKNKQGNGLDRKGTWKRGI